MQDKQTSMYMLTPKPVRKCLQRTVLVSVCVVLAYTHIRIITNYLVARNRKAVLKQYFAKYNQITSNTKEPVSVVDIEHIKINDTFECAKRELLVYTCNGWCGGWGDRQLGIITGFLLALLSNRIFVIDMNSPCKLEDVMDSNLYNWLACKPFLQNVSNEETIHVNRSDSMTLPSEILRPDFATNGRKRVIRLRTNRLILSTIRQHEDVSNYMKWILNMPDEAVIHLVLNILFKNKEKAQNQMHEFIDNTVRGRKLVCAHIRKVKNPTLPTDGSLPAINESTIFSFLQDYSDYTRYLVYVASDSEKVKGKAVESVPNVATTNKTIVHVNIFNKKQMPVAKLIEGFATVLYEQDLLSRCDILVLTRSNYGFNAAHMRDRPDGLFTYIPVMDKVNATNMRGIWEDQVAKNHIR